MDVPYVPTCRSGKEEAVTEPSTADRLLTAWEAERAIECGIRRAFTGEHTPRRLESLDRREEWRKVREHAFEQARDCLARERSER